MNATIKKLETILTSAYSNQNYLELVKEIFDSVQIVNPNGFNKEFSNFSSHIEGTSHIANYVSPDAKKITIIAVRLKANAYVENSRSTQRNYAKKMIENANSDAALVAFYTENDPKWRLSFVRLDYEMKIEKGRLKTIESLTPAKRYSYLVGVGEPCHTAIDRLHAFVDTHNYHPTLEDIEGVFSVEKVTEEFYQLYSDKFEKLRDDLDKSEDFRIEAEQHNFTSAQFAKKLMGQIVFLYFLQKKGWLGVSAWPKKLSEKEYKKAFFAKGAKSRELIPIVYRPIGEGVYGISRSGLESLNSADEAVLAACVNGEAWGSGPSNFMRKLFDEADKKHADFYHDYLEPLFYETLNVNRGEQGYCPALHCRIPFLSGGLFEPIDGYEWKHNNFNLPNTLFSNRTNNNSRTGDGILDIFDRFNFTMSEDEPMEREVAIDPEMLGKVFENLLEDRKSKGAFYTPREIVHYMCQESLINYLANTVDLPTEDVRDFILYGDFMKDEDTIKSKREGNGGLFIAESIFKIDKNGNVSVNRMYDLDKALANVRVVDPAVGSGAFPLGMLNEILRARQTITEYLIFDQKIQAVSVNQESFISHKLHTERSAYNLKYHTIKNCLFAADIEPSAVDIAQLRLWLSLVIDDEVDSTATNPLYGHRNPLPLPNLEYNILCGNSLIDELNGIQLINPSYLYSTEKKGNQIDYLTNIFEKTITSLIEAQDELFRCNDPLKKAEWKEIISSLRDFIIKHQLSDCSPETLNEYEKSKKQSSKPYILWALDFARVFREKDGFDIVIGNPPYIGESGHKEIFREVAKTRFGSKCYQGKMDFFYFFFHKGLDLLNNTGDLAFITTNYFPTATGAKRLRKEFAEKTYIRQLINFNEVKVFESALGQHNMVTLLTKDKRKTFECRSTTCSESITATSEKIKLILNGKDSSATTIYIGQTNIFDGDEYYIRQAGVTSNTFDSLGSILDKMAFQNQRLASVAEVNQGVVSGCDTVSNRNMQFISTESGKIKNDGIFVFDLCNSRDVEVIESFINGSQLLRDFYKNSDISRYSCSNTATKKLLYYPEALDVEQYPDIVNHLEHFHELLANRLIAYNERYHWTALHRPRKQHIFEGEKIVVPYRTKQAAFAYNNTEWFCRSDVYVITAKSSTINLFLLLGILNSKMTFIWLYNRGKRKGEVLELFQTPLSEIPIPNLSDEDKSRISDLALKITEYKSVDSKKDTIEMEKEIDQIIYRAYELSSAEITIVEENAK